jgi:FixJ family two-component response regulator
VDRFTVFLIDDDVGTLTALSRFLRAAGYATKTHYSSQAFLSGHDVSIPGCVILDLSLMGLNGLDVQQSLLDQGIERPVIFISGKTAAPEIVRAMKAGAIDFLIKPVDENQLLKAIKTAEEWDNTRRNIEARRKIILQKIAELSKREKRRFWLYWLLVCKVRLSQRSWGPVRKPLKCTVGVSTRKWE